MKDRLDMTYPLTILFFMTLAVWLTWYTKNRKLRKRQKR